ncbi:MAG: class I SAM-dependent methyltransferase [Beijerinckiaceae bacterium]|nr:MAG: class I SAM-dependent methyltransferase [Beijerinckiaceae bacterium]
MAHIFSSDWFEANRWQFEQQTAHLSPNGEHQFLEIGSYEGRSACWLLDRFPLAHITCVDIHEQPTFWHNIGESNGAGRVSLHLGQSRDVLRQLERDVFDFVYIDGCHHTVPVLEDAVLAFRLAKVGALIGFDDYLWNDPAYNSEGTPKDAIDAFLRVYGYKVSVRAKNYQVWLTKSAD